MAKSITWNCDNVGSWHIDIHIIFIWSYMCIQYICVPRIYIYIYVIICSKIYCTCVFYKLYKWTCVYKFYVYLFIYLSIHPSISTHPFIYLRYYLKLSIHNPSIYLQIEIYQWSIPSNGYFSQVPRKTCQTYAFWNLCGTENVPTIDKNDSLQYSISMLGYT